MIKNVLKNALKIKGVQFYYMNNDNFLFRK